MYTGYFFFLQGLLSPYNYRACPYFVSQSVQILFGALTEQTTYSNKGYFSRSLETNGTVNVKDG